MATLERAVDRGTRIGRATLVRIGQELREARVDRDLPITVVAKAVGLSAAEVSRIERGLVPGVSMLTLSRLSSVVGLDLVTRLYPGPTPIRDAGQIELLGRFRAELHRSVAWAIEVPIPRRGDQRAWDAVISGTLSEGGTARPTTRWRFGVEAETGPRDAQALLRRNRLKLRDSNLDGFLVVMPGTRRTRAFYRAADLELMATCPVPGRRALELLRAGLNPGGNAIILLPPRAKVPPTRS